MLAFLVRLAINAVALVVAARIVEWAQHQGYIDGGIRLEGLYAIVLTTFIFGLVNALIRPIVLIATCPINLLTLGLFTLVINALMLWLTSWVIDQLNRSFSAGIAFHVDGFIPAFLGAIVISIVSAVLTRVIR